MEVGEGKDGSEKCLPDKSRKPVEPTSPPDEAKATQDQGDQSMTSVSARSALCDHPAETEMTTDPARPLEDLADMTGDKEHHPDKPTKLPDKPESMAWHGNEQSVEGVQSRGLRVLRVSTEGTESTGDNGVKTR